MPIPYIEELIKSRKRRNEQTAQSAAPFTDINALKDNYVRDFIKTAYTYPFRPCSTPYIELLPCLEGIYQHPGLSTYFTRNPRLRSTLVKTIAPVLPLWDFSRRPKQTKQALDMVEWLLFDTSVGEWGNYRIREAILITAFFRALHRAWAHFGYRHHVFRTTTPFQIVDLYHDTDVEPLPLPEWLLLDNVCARGSIDTYDRGTDVSHQLDL